MASPGPNAPVVDSTAGGGGPAQGVPEPSHIENKDPKKLPTVVLVVGMAGSGKSRLMHRFNIEMHEKQIPSFFINLDPAVLDVPYGVNIDIRNTVNYKEVMKQYNLGPNGAIITSLNLFATRFDQVISYLERKENELKYVFIDTPGQIEVFTWSASGQIIVETLASTFPTVVCYVMDTARSSSPATFMSNMTYCSSILYRTRLPLLLCLNKIDIADHRKLIEWMQDPDLFSDALQEQSTYSAQLTRSMSVVLSEFYQNLRCAGVSAVTGEGAAAVFKAIDESTVDYINLFLPELIALTRKKREKERKKKEEEMERFRADLDISKGHKVVSGAGMPWDGPTEDGTDEDEVGSEEGSDEYAADGPTRAGMEDDPGDDGAPPRHLIERMEREEEEEETEEHREFLAYLSEQAKKGAQ